MDTKRLYFALLTPFKSDNGIDYGVLKEYIQFLEEHGANSIVTNGTTGEFPSLTINERKGILEFCKKNFKGTIMNNISSCCIFDSLDLLEHSNAYGDSVLLLPPYYFAGVTDSGLEMFFGEILKRSQIPVYLYNFPKHAKIKISPELINRLLANYPNLAGIKDSSGSLESFNIYNEISPKFSVYAGSDSLMIDALKSGVAGSISGSGNPMPEFPVSIFNYYLNDNIDMAEKTQRHYNVWNDFRKNAGFSEIPLLKAIMGIRIKGFPIYTRTPFIDLDELSVNKAREKFKEHVQDFLQIR